MVIRWAIEPTKYPVVLAAKKNMGLHAIDPWSEPPT